MLTTDDKSISSGIVRCAPEMPLVLSDTHLGAKVSSLTLVSQPKHCAKCTLYAIAPVSVQRYCRKVKIPRKKSRHVIRSMMKPFSHPAPPNGWKSHEHPEGAHYFSYKGHKLVGAIFTDAHLFDPQVFLRISGSLEQIAEMIMKINEDFSSYELVLDLQRSRNGEFYCGYYFVDNSTRSLLWLEDFDATPLLVEVQGAIKPSHLRHEIESQYWQHWELYPNTRVLTPRLVTELKEIILHASGDTLTSQSSTSPYGLEDLNSMRSLVKDMTPTTGDEDGVGHSACVFGRFMATFAHQRFLNFHGQNGARLDRDVSIHGTKRRRSVFVKVISAALFYAPDVHLNALEKIWVDQTVGHVPWNKLIGRLTTEWRDFTLYAVLLLNANITFLSIPSVGDDIGDARIRSGARIAGYVSIASSIGTIILGLLYLRQYRTKVRDSAGEALKVLTVRGLDTLAIIFCLPYALLMWGGVSFTIALLLTCLQTISVVSTSIMGVVVVMIAMLILWAIWANWESTVNSLNAGTADDTVFRTPGLVDDFDEKPNNKRWNFFTPRRNAEIGSPV